MSSAAALLVLGGALAGLWLWFRLPPKPSRKGEARLLRICRGEIAQAERLLQGELTRSPGISRAEAASRAVERHRRDNR